MKSKPNLWSVCIALCFTLFSCSEPAKPVITTEAAPSVIAAKNKTTSEQSYTFFNDNKLEEAAKLYAEDYISHDAVPLKGRAAKQADFAKIRKDWPDIKVTIEQVVAEGDWVMIRSTATGTHTSVIMGVKPTQKKMTATYWDVHHYNKAGLIAESWNMTDNAALMQQLGLLPAAKK